MPQTHPSSKMTAQRHFSIKYFRSKSLFPKVFINSNLSKRKNKDSLKPSTYNNYRQINRYS